VFSSSCKPITLLWSTWEEGRFFRVIILYWNWELEVLAQRHRSAYLPSFFSHGAQAYSSLCAKVSLSSVSFITYDKILLKCICLKSVCYQWRFPWPRNICIALPGVGNIQKILSTPKLFEGNLQLLTVKWKRSRMSISRDFTVLSCLYLFRPSFKAMKKSRFCF
jgi:hypothetical protein